MPATQNIPVQKVSGNECVSVQDSLAVEEPLELRLEWGKDGARQQQTVSVTMRTPGNDAALATGFLFTEGIIPSYQSIGKIVQQDENVVAVSLMPGVTINLQKSERNFYTTSSCGVCGKSSLDAIRTAIPLPVKSGKSDSWHIGPELLFRLPAILRQQQEVFATTGGLHASALFDLSGNLLLLREDVGRHNALDKLIGAALQQDLLPLAQNILLLSGRASFELVQKAAMAGISLIAAVGAPSSLAVQLAAEFDITLCGFLRGERFNIYTGARRIIVPQLQPVSE